MSRDEVVISKAGKETAVLIMRMILTKTPHLNQFKMLKPYSIVRMMKTESF
jgi:hypothetical protein